MKPPTKAAYSFESLTVVARRKAALKAVSPSFILTTVEEVEVLTTVALFFF